MRRSLIRPLTRIGIALTLGLATLVVSPGQANADALICADSHGAATTCLTVKGTADLVESVRVAHSEGIWPYRICDWAAGVWYTPASTGVQTYYQTATYWRCESAWAISVSVTINFNNMRMRNPSYVIGAFYHDGNWSPGRPAAVVSRY